MLADEFMDLVRRMRDAQRAWFKNHDRIDLIASKELEREVDRELKRIAKPDPQPTLFD